MGSEEEIGYNESSASKNRGPKGEDRQKEVETILIISKKLVDVSPSRGRTNVYIFATYSINNI